MCFSPTARCMLPRVNTMPARVCGRLTLNAAMSFSTILQRQERERDKQSQERKRERERIPTHICMKTSDALHSRAIPSAAARLTIKKMLWNHTHTQIHTRTHAHMHTRIHIHVHNTNTQKERQNECAAPDAGLYWINMVRRPMIESVTSLGGKDVGLERVSKQQSVWCVCVLDYHSCVFYYGQEEKKWRTETERSKQTQRKRGNESDVFIPIWCKVSTNGKQGSSHVYGQCTDRDVRAQTTHIRARPQTYKHAFVYIHYTHTHMRIHWERERRGLGGRGERESLLTFPVFVTLFGQPL